MIHRRDKAAQTGRPYTRPSIAFHKGSLHYVQRVRNTSSRIKSFVCHQLPILTALHARSPTLFATIIHDGRENVNPHFHFFSDLVKKTEAGGKNGQVWSSPPKNGRSPLKFVHFDEKTLKRTVIPLAFCALLLYNNANLLEGGPACGRADRNFIRQGRHR